MRSTEGISLVEIAVVLVVLGAVLVIALPSLARARARVEVMAARENFTTLHALARQISAQYGRISRLHVDPGGGRVWVTVDTSSQAGSEVRDTIGEIWITGGEAGGVWLEGKPRTICFDPRGLATARGDCDLPNATLVFRCGAVADTITISRLGRVLRR
jgi:type II secretory pathway pseudopilin PulG